ncbi:LYR motif-containing protein 4-like, partial [Leptonychotes weddellii]|uniref:LYR motif-containing protein 4-like n=1 Tax=Leptonychotes weddellii TaxID=9713 RepID=A0A7F8Q1D9_LEPWE
MHLGVQKVSPPLRTICIPRELPRLDFGQELNIQHADYSQLYRAYLKVAKRVSPYSFRTYTVRRIRDAFRENKNVKDPVEIQALVNKAKRDLGIIRRQMFLSHCGLPGNEMKERLQENKKS